MRYGGFDCKSTLGVRYGGFDCKSTLRCGDMEGLTVSLPWV